MGPHAPTCEVCSMVTRDYSGWASNASDEDMESDKAKARVDFDQKEAAVRNAKPPSR
jgi:hypothetical protein